MTVINIKYCLIIVLCLGLIGCASAPEKPFVEPQYGMTMKQLVDLLGSPASMEIYQKPDKTRVEFYVYTHYYQSSQGVQETKIPVCLIDNKVVGWGKTFYEDHISTDDIRIK